MSARRTSAIGVLMLLVLLAPDALAQRANDLSGRWVRDSPLGPVQNDVAPAWEEISLVDGVVMIRRAPSDRSSPELVTASTEAEVYAGDGVERSSPRVRTSRQCRSQWEGGQFVLECRQLDGGPGGKAPEVLTREVRFVDGDGRLVLEVTWRSDERIVTRRAVYRREQQ